VNDAVNHKMTQLNDSLLFDDLTALGNQIDAALLAWEQVGDPALLRLAMQSVWAIAVVYDRKTFEGLINHANPGI
jgi:hypothetical protein